MCDRMCPICHTPLDYRQMTFGQRYTTRETFRCQSCATMLRWTHRYRGCELFMQTALLVFTISAAPIFVYAPLSSGLRSSVPLRVMFITLLLATAAFHLWGPWDLIQHSDE